MKTYREKLLDPRWQKKRLEVLERAGWACEACGDTESTLHIHHGVYRWGEEPWEARADTLWSLCDGCHAAAECHRQDGKTMLGQIHPTLLGAAIGFLSRVVGMRAGTRQMTEFSTHAEFVSLLKRLS